MQKVTEADLISEYERGKQHGKDDRRLMESHAREQQREIDRLKRDVSELKKVLADKRRLAREIDVAINGDDAAAQASLCDILSQLKGGHVKRVSLAAEWMVSGLRMPAGQFVIVRIAGESKDISF
jgi:hypothetical protein